MERLRAALTPRTLALLLAMMLLAGLLLFSDDHTEMTALEERASQVLSQVHGAGNVSVVIAVRSPAEKTEYMAARTQTREEVPVGAVAVAQGADDPFVCARLTQALCALLGLPASAVSVISGGE